MQFVRSVLKMWHVARGGDKTTSFSTSNLWKHLQIHHLDKLKELLESEKAASKEKASSSQVTIKECLERAQPFPSDHPTAQKITHLIGKMMAVDCQPFSIIEDQGFIALLSQLQPRYKFQVVNIFQQH